MVTVVFVVLVVVVLGLVVVVVEEEVPLNFLKEVWRLCLFLNLPKDNTLEAAGSGSSFFFIKAVTKVMITFIIFLLSFCSGSAELSVS